MRENAPTSGSQGGVTHRCASSATPIKGSNNRLSGAARPEIACPAIGDARNAVAIVLPLVRTTVLPIAIAAAAVRARRERQSFSAAAPSTTSGQIASGRYDIG